MSCPTCNHAMHILGSNDSFRRHWCPRCGTLVNVFFSVNAAPDEGSADTTSVDVPKLVERCRDYQIVAIADDDPEGFFATEWKRLGIAESINLPGDRPQ